MGGVRTCVPDTKSRGCVSVYAIYEINPPFRALPLTWSSPAASSIVHQRDMLVAAVKRVYGYSETDLFHNRATTEGRNLPGKSYRDIKQNWELKRKRMTQGRDSNGNYVLV